MLKSGVILGANFRSPVIGIGDGVLSRNPDDGGPFGSGAKAGGVLSEHRGRFIPPKGLIQFTVSLRERKGGKIEIKKKY